MKLFFSISILFLVVSCSNGYKSESSMIQNEKVEQVQIDFNKSSEMLDEESYWKLIEKSFTNSKNYGVQRQVLLNELSKLSPKEIIGFSLYTSKLLKDSYTSELWCAAYIIKGGCSDDGFEYFRLWLISKGKDIFYNAVKNPDNLADLKKRLLFDYELEELLYLPSYAFNARTGKEIYDYMDMDKFWKEEGTYNEIEFNWQESDRSSMKNICPRLYKKF